MVGHSNAVVSYLDRAYKECQGRIPVLEDSLYLSSTI